MASIEKDLMLKEVKQVLEGNDVFFTNFNKVKVDNFGQLRRDIHRKSAQGVVAKKSIARLALKDLGMEAALPAIDGQIFMVAAKDNPQDVSKQLVDFAKEQEDFNIQGVYLEGAFHTAEYVEQLAKLPSREQLIATVLCGMKAPINNFVLTLNALLKNFVVVLNEVSKKKSEVSN